MTRFYESPILHSPLTTPQQMDQSGMGIKIFSITYMPTSSKTTGDTGVECFTIHILLCCQRLEIYITKDRTRMGRDPLGRCIACVFVDHSIQQQSR